MKKNLENIRDRSVPSNRYTRSYFLEHSNGYLEFLNSRGLILPPRLNAAFRQSKITKGMRILDVGCGRGEILVHAYLLGAAAYGVDYSAAAIEIAGSNLATFQNSSSVTSLHLIQADCTEIPFSIEVFDIIFLLDIVEHLNPAELERTLKSIYSVLKPKGKLIIHTMPNIWYYQYGYPIYRAFQRARGIHLPLDPRDRWGFRDVHINEQSPKKLRMMLEKCGYNARVKTTSVMNYSHESNRFIRAGMKLVSRAPFLRWCLGNDIYAIAKRRH